MVRVRMISLSLSSFRFALILSVLLSGRNERPGARTPEPLIAAAARRVSRSPIGYFEIAGSRLRSDASKPVRGIERDFDARTIGWISRQNLDRIGRPCLLATLKTCPPR